MSRYRKEDWEFDFSNSSIQPIQRRKAYIWIDSADDQPSEVSVAVYLHHEKWWCDWCEANGDVGGCIYNREESAIAEAERVLDEMIDEIVREQSES